jgi:hypothetical protein
MGRDEASDAIGTPSIVSWKAATDVVVVVYVIMTIVLWASVDVVYIVIIVFDSLVLLWWQ